MDIGSNEIGVSRNQRLISICQPFLFYIGTGQPQVHPHHFYWCLYFFLSLIKGLFFLFFLFLCLTLVVIFDATDIVEHLLWPH